LSEAARAGPQRLGDVLVEVEGGEDEDPARDAPSRSASVLWGLLAATLTWRGMVAAWRAA
jgi:hypothetical protein